MSFSEEACFIVILSVVMLNVVMSNVVAPFSAAVVALLTKAWLMLPSITPGANVIKLFMAVIVAVL